jgi:DNA invertase Pin-like site-specific DNA recombinase
LTAVTLNLQPSTLVPETILPQIAFGYGRVSTDRQGLSREAQTETVTRAAEYYTGNNAPEEMYFDEDTSGSIPFAERPAGQQLLARIQAAVAQGASPTIICTKVDRLGRDTVDVSQTVTLFAQLGARIVFLDINVDTRTAMGRAFMQIAAVFAELERARIRDRIQTALDLKRSQNLVTGTVPYGWDDRPTGAFTKAGKPIRELVPNEAEQAIILEMARKLATGISYTQMAKDLNRRGIPTKRRGEKLNIGRIKGQCRIKAAVGLWTPGIVKNCLTNKTVQAFLAQHEI